MPSECVVLLGDDLICRGIVPFCGGKAAFGGAKWGRGKAVNCSAMARR